MAEFCCESRHEDEVLLVRTNIKLFSRRSLQAETREEREQAAEQMLHWQQRQKALKNPHIRLRSMAHYLSRCPECNDFNISGGYPLPIESDDDGERSPHHVK